MQRANPFKRVHLLMAAMASLMTTAVGGAAQAVTREQAYTMAGGYQSRGKRKTKSHDYGGVRTAQRAARKRRNQRRNRLAHRGVRS